MPLIGGVSLSVGAIYNSSYSNDDSTTTSSVESNVEANTNPLTEETQAVEEISVTTAGSSSVTGNSATGTDYYRYRQGMDQGASSSVSGYQAASREDAVIAVDFVRREAIATQSALKAESLFADLEKVDTYSLLSPANQDVSTAYSRADAVDRGGEKTQMSA